MKKILALSVALAGFAAAPAQAACGDEDTPCETANGSYHITLPKGDGPHPVMVFLHGFGGTGSALVRDGGSSREANERGFAYIAPNALPRPGGDRTSWSFHPDFHDHRDERAFFREVLNDAAEQFNVDPDHAILAGFSIGGSMTSYIACDFPNDFVAYAPVSGSLWRPHRQGCEGPVRLLHTHGWRDKTVPLEGRVVGKRNDTEFAQGDVFRSMRLWREVNGCSNYRADSFQTDEYFWRRTWEHCQPGTALQFVMFDGAHGIPRGWADIVFDWLDELQVPTQ